MKLPSWFVEALDSRKAAEQPNGSCSIGTLEGTHRADPDDWIIQGIKGELYPCKPDIFEATYEPVKE